LQDIVFIIVAAIMNESDDMAFLHVPMCGQSVIERSRKRSESAAAIVYSRAARIGESVAQNVFVVVIEVEPAQIELGRNNIIFGNINGHRQRLVENRAAAKAAKIDIGRKLAARIVETIADIDINLRLATEFGSDITRPTAEAQRALRLVGKQFSIDAGSGISRNGSKLGIDGIARRGRKIFDAFGVRHGEKARMNANGDDFRLAVLLDELSDFGRTHRTIDAAHTRKFFNQNDPFRLTFANHGRDFSATRRSKKEQSAKRNSEILHGYIVYMKVCKFSVNSAKAQIKSL
jgi:hypothetical protein